MEREEKSRQEMEFNLSNDGRLNYKGASNSDTKEIINMLAAQAAYYRDKSLKFEERRLKATEADPVICVFVICFSLVSVFGLYSLSHSILKMFNSHSKSEVIENVRKSSQRYS
jgi:hypothetical protein